MHQTVPKKPVFDEFRKLFFEQVNSINGSKINDPFLKWNETGSSETRSKILESFHAKISELYGIELEKKKPLADIDGYIESVVVQIHHEYSTMYLIERINDKIRAKKN